MTIGARVIRWAGQRLPTGPKSWLIWQRDRLQARTPARRQALAHMRALAATRPLGLSLETNSRCNAKCVFCARRKIPQQNLTMSMELFGKVCSEYSQLGGGFLGFSPLLADPLLDPMLFDRIRLVQRQHLDIRLHMFTNGIGLQRLSDDELASLLRSLDHIDVSIGGLNRSDYRTMFGVDQFDGVWAGLLRLASMNQASGGLCKLGLHVRTHRDLADVTASPELRQLVDLGFACCDIINTFANWGGLVTQADMPSGATVQAVPTAPRRSACLYPTTYLQVMPDGRALACGCMDAQGELQVGDLNRSTLAEVWTGAQLTRLRASFAEGNLNRLCRSCTYYVPHERILGHPRLREYRAGQNLWAGS